MDTIMTGTTASSTGPHTSGWQEPAATGMLVLADGLRIEGTGLGATGHAAGEICFNTAMTGYQEILTDPSYAAQIITFTFPHIGIVGTNEEDIETVNMADKSAVRGAIFRTIPTNPSNFRATQHLDDWLKKRGIVAIAGIDTRALTAYIRDNGMPNGVIAHNPDADFDLKSLESDAAAWPGLVGMDLAKEVTCGQSYVWDETPWSPGTGYGQQSATTRHVVATDYGDRKGVV